MGTNRLVLIRTDGNSKIATGHLMRCLSIADACMNLDMQVVFLVSDKESEDLLKSFLTTTHFPPENIFRLSCGDYQNLEKELDELFPLLNHILTITGCRADDAVFFLDSYYVTPRYLEMVGSQIKLAYMDDLQLFDYPVDLLINYDIIPVSRKKAYESAYQKAGKTLLGGFYTPIRKQFCEKQILLRDTVSNMLITSGGSDPQHFCLKLATALTLHPKLTASIQFHIVIGRLNEDKNMLYELASQNHFITLHENVTDMASLMASCDLAVSAAGTTLYELCALGIPTISYTMADNQITSAKAFAETNAIPYAGDIRSQESQVFEYIFSFMTKMSQNYSQRKNAHEIMSKLVDLGGSKRIAEAFYHL